MANWPSSDLSLKGLRICIVGPHPPRPGGMSTQVALLSDCLRADGVEVRSVDTNVRWLRRLGRPARPLLPLAQVVAVTARLWRAAAGADVIHVHLSSFWGFYMPLTISLLMGRLRRVPVIATYHGGKAPTFVPRHRRWLRALLGRTAAFIALSPWTGNIFEGAGLHPEIIPNVVQVEQFQTYGAESRMASNGRGPALLWIKHFQPNGNPQLMVRAFARLRQELPDATLTMMGDGELLPETQALARELQIPIEFTGRLPFQQVKERYRQADLFVSSSAIDNQPCTMLEASACGLPIVATAVGGVPHLLADGVNGLLTPPDDCEALAAAVLRLARDPQLAMQIGAAALQNAKQYSWPAVRQKLGRLYVRVAKSA